MRGINLMVIYEEPPGGCRVREANGVTAEGVCWQGVKIKLVHLQNKLLPGVSSLKWVVIAFAVV